MKRKKCAVLFRNNYRHSCRGGPSGQMHVCNVWSESMLGSLVSLRPGYTHHARGSPGAQWHRGSCELAQGRAVILPSVNMLVRGLTSVPLIASALGGIPEWFIESKGKSIFNALNRKCQGVFYLSLSRPCFLAGGCSSSPCGELRLGTQRAHTICLWNM